jgi:hypothetical protein
MNILSNLALFCFVLSSLTSPITIHQSRFGETTFNSPSDLSWRQLWFDEIQVFDAHYVEKGSQAIYGRSISYFLVFSLSLTIVLSFIMNFSVYQLKVDRIGKLLILQLLNSFLILTRLLKLVIFTDWIDPEGNRYKVTYMFSEGAILLMFGNFLGMLLLDTNKIDRSMIFLKETSQSRSIDLDYPNLGKKEFEQIFEY